MKRLTLATILLLLATLLAGCGKKGPVRPKLATLPPPPAVMELHQQGESLLLSWEVPQASEDLAGFSIRRLAYDAADACPTCREPQDEVARLDLGNPAPGQRIGQRIYWRDAAVSPGSGYRYAVHPLTVGGMVCPPALLHRAVLSPPEAPGSLRAEPGDGQVALKWQAPALAEDAELLGYNLYRRSHGQPFPAVPVNPEPLKGTALVNRGLQPGQGYEFRVTSLVRAGGMTLESEPTAGLADSPSGGSR